MNPRPIPFYFERSCHRITVQLSVCNFYLVILSFGTQVMFG
jgi:hypothetical protein